MPTRPAGQLERLGRELRRRRGEMGLTQIQAAERLGVTRVAYQDWEGAKSQPRESHLAAIEEQFEIPAFDIIDPPPVDNDRVASELSGLRTEIAELMQRLEDAEAAQES